MPIPPRPMGRSIEARCPASSAGAGMAKGSYRTSSPMERPLQICADSAMASTARGKRSIWSGSISFGLLQIPVTLHAAENRSEELHFRLLDKRDLAPIRYGRVSSSTGKPVEWKDIVRGYEIAPDEFVVLDPADLRAANV